MSTSTTIIPTQFSRFEAICRIYDLIPQCQVTNLTTQNSLKIGDIQQKYSNKAGQYT